MFGDRGLSRLEMLTFEGLSQEHLQFLEGWDVPEQVFLEATKRSSRNGDVLLTHQVSVMHHVYMFIGSMAKLWSWSRTHLTDAARGTCTKEPVVLIKALRAAFAALKIFPSSPPQAEQSHHNSNFENLFTTELLIKGCETELEAAMKPFEVAWKKDLLHLAGTIGEAAPDNWADSRDTLLSHKDIVKSFLQKNMKSSS